MIVRNPMQQVLDALNARNSLNLTLENVDFVDAHPPTTEDEIYFAKGKNTTATLVAKQGAPGLGKKKVYYDRYPLTQMFADADALVGEKIVVPVDLNSVTTSHDVIPALNYYYGIYIRPEDVEPVLVDKEALTVILRFESTAPGFTGEIKIKLVSGGALLAPNFPNVEVKGPYEYPYFNTKVGQGSVYAYGYVFDDYAVELKAANTTFSMDRLAQILADVTGHPWEVFRLPKEYNLKEAKISYNGPNHSSFKSNPLAENVLIIELSLYCINFGGQMILHYADPS